MGTLVCAPLMVEDVERALEEARYARALGAALVEYRVDAMYTGEADQREAIALLVRESACPCVVTCRSSEEGGSYAGDDASRLALYEALWSSEEPPAYVDVELSTLERDAAFREAVRAHALRAAGAERATRVIVSSHDFEGRPRDLSRRVGAMIGEECATVVKVAFRARSLRDNLELFELLGAREKPTIALGMGRFGLMSRVLAPKFGGFLTFASVRAEATTAPGQPTIAELIGRYRFASIGARTTVYGVVGWPAEHSIGPDVHNAAFEAVGHDGVYLPLPVPEEWEHFKATVLALLDDERLDFCGCSVTMPHKGHALRLAEERGWAIDEAASACGAANTLVRTGGGVRVMNTDVAGVRAPLEEVLGGSLSGARVLVYGAGGAARAAAVACAQADEVCVANRTRARAEELAGATGARVVEVGALSGERFDAVVQCTPVGMAGGERASEVAIGEGVLRAWAERGEGCVIFETVYTPRRTPLVELAESLGFRTVEGLRMFVEQARAQSSAWTGVEAPDRVMARVAREILDTPRGA